MCVCVCACLQNLATRIRNSHAFNLPTFYLPREDGKALNIPNAIEDVCKSIDQVSAHTDTHTQREREGGRKTGCLHSDTHAHTVTQIHTHTLTDTHRALDNLWRQASDTRTHMRASTCHTVDCMCQHVVCVHTGRQHDSAEEPTLLLCLCVCVYRPST